MNEQNPLIGETLISLSAAAQDFGGVPIPLNTVQKYESVYSNIHLILRCSV